MIPKAIVAALEKLVRDRDRQKRLALDRAPVRSADRRRELAARDLAVRKLLFLVDVEGVNTLSRGGRGCIWEAVKALRPEVAKVWKEKGSREAMDRFFPDPEG